jgi:ATP-dependent exoDNAse (exonuclease V) beta subunit
MTTAEAVASSGLSDARARRDVENSLDSTMFVEAGAGSGKTTALVARIVRLICSGRCELGEPAAVTFTEAAAAELRVRVRERLADVAGGANTTAGSANETQPGREEERRRARQALDHIDEARISTIHGLCRRLLAEHPIESGLPPRFEVMDEVQQSLEWSKQWSAGLDAFGEDPGIRGLFQVASLLSINRVEEMVRDVAEEWDRCGTVPPDGLAVVAAVEAIVTRAASAVVAALDTALVLAGHCQDPTDRLALRLEELVAHRDLLAATTRWEDQLAAMAGEELSGAQLGKKASWLCDVNDVRAALSAAGEARKQAVQDCCDVLLPALVAMADVFAHSLAAKRRAAGRLTFHDLLVLARDLLASQPWVLDRVRDRLRYLLVDEFQDTDPLQLEIAELIAFGGGLRPRDAVTVLGQEVALVGLGPVGRNGTAGGPGNGHIAGRGADAGGGVSDAYAAAQAAESDARVGVRFHPGAGAQSDAGAADAQVGRADTGRLFLVGDPQQSIYRFRGADLDAYVAARERHAGNAATTLTSNFRSVPGILEFVNECFTSILPGFSRLDAVRPDAASGPPVRVVGKPFRDPKLRRFAQREIESEECAQAIERAVRSEMWMVEDKARISQRPSALRPARLSDVAILVPRRTGLDQIEAALDARGIGYRVESASLIFRSQEVRNLLALCRAIDAPGDELALVAALRSPAFACGDDDLRAYRALGGRWSIDAPCPPPHGFSGSPAAPAEPSGTAGDPAVVTQALRRLASYRTRRCELGPVGVLELAVRDRRLLQLAMTTPRVRESWRRVRFLLEQARAFVDAGGGGLSEFADWVDEQVSEGLRAVESVLPEPDEDVVHILTVHGAKGLEFPITVLAGFGTTDVVTGPNRPQILRNAGRVEVRFRKARLETSGYERLFAEKQRREQEEAARVLYVAATRARDHLIFCAHHAPVSGPNPSLGQTLYEAAREASTTRPFLCEFVELGEPSAEAGIGQGALFSLDAVVPPEGSARGGAARGRSGAAATAVPLDEGPADPVTGGTRTSGSAVASAVEACRQAYLSWKEARAELLDRVRRPAGVTATEVAELAGAKAAAPAGAKAAGPTGGGAAGAAGGGAAGAAGGGAAGAAGGGAAGAAGAKAAQLTGVGDAQPASGLGSSREAKPDGSVDPAAARGGDERGRAARRIGRAVHATLQSIGLEAARALAGAPSAESHELRRIASAQAQAEHVAEYAREVELLAKVALSSPTVRAAFASPRVHRELYVSTRIGDVVLDGFIDLCFEDGAGLVVVDYKTDRVDDLSEIEVLAERYELQAAAYALGLGAAVGKPVSRCVLVFLRAPEAIEHEVSDLSARIAEVREVVAAASGDEPLGSAGNAAGRG